MSLRLQSVLGLLLILLIAAACSHKAVEAPPLPEQNTTIVYPPLPPTKCQRIPTPPDVGASDNEWAAYKHARDNSGDDCRDKLDAIDAVVSKWPRGQVEQPKP